MLALAGCEREAPTQPRRAQTATNEATGQPGAGDDRPELIEPPRVDPEANGGRSVPADIAAVDLPPGEQWLGRAPSPPVVDAGHRGEVLLEAGDETVTLAEVDLQLRTTPVPSQALMDSAEARRRYAEQAARHTLLVAEARRRGLADDPAARFERLVGLATALRLVVFEEAATASVDDAAVAAFYETHRDDFVHPEVRTGHAITAPTREAAEALRDEVLRRAPQPAATRQRTFELIARRQAGGGQPLEASPDNPGALEQQLFELDTYAVSEVVELGDDAPDDARFGFVILTGATPARDVSLDDARDQIRQALDATRGPQVWSEMTEALVTAAKPERHPEALDHVEVRKGATTAADALAVDPAHAADPVLTIGETTVDLATAAEGLARWPRLQQQAVLHADRADEYLDRLVVLVALAEEARRRGLDRHPMVDIAVERRLAALLGDRVRAEATPTEVTDAQVRAHFEAHPDEYRRPERRRAVHVVVDSREAAEALRETILETAPDATRARVEAVATLAAEQATDPEVKQRSGRLPYVTRDDADNLGVAEPLRATAFALDLFELSEPIELADDQWALLIVDAVRDEVVVPFERVQAAIRHELERTPAEEAWRELLERLETDTEVTAHPEVLEHVHLAPAPSHDHEH